MRVLVLMNSCGCPRGFIPSLKEHYIVDVATECVQGECLSEVNDYKAIIIDNDLFNDAGVEVCTEIRSTNNTTPIIVLSSADEVGNKINCLDAGADAYITKPINIQELLAELRSLIRRGPEARVENKMCIGDLFIDIKNKQVTCGDIVIYLRRKEFDLLEYLVFNKYRVVSKEEILENVWDRALDIPSNTVEVHIKLLRDKLQKYFGISGRNFVKTNRGFGYSLVEL